jgi:methionine-rich copper-binding protein CopC
VTVTQSARAMRALLLGLVVLAVGAGPVAAHAELVSSDPADGATVTGSPDEVVTVFDEPLLDNSSMELIGPDGSRVATGDVDPADRTRMVIAVSDITPGEYEARWTAASADGHVERGTFGFTVVEPTPSPTASPTPRPSEMPSPRPSAGPTPSPTPSGNGTPAGGAADVLFPLLGVVIAIVALGALLMRNRRTAGR